MLVVVKGIRFVHIDSSKIIDLTLVNSESTRGTLVWRPWKYHCFIFFQPDSKMILSLDEEAIIWPGGLTQKPTGLMIPTHLKVRNCQFLPPVFSLIQLCPNTKVPFRCGTSSDLQWVLISDLNPFLGAHNNRKTVRVRPKIRKIFR